MNSKTNTELWPKCPQAHRVLLCSSGQMLRLLFICSRNHWRSPTAEAVYQNDPRVQVASAGVSPKAQRRVTEKLLRWADLVLVMEPSHRRRLHEQFPVLAPELRIEVLDIPDDYEFMDPELIELIRASVEPLLEPLA